MTVHPTLHVEVEPGPAAEDGLSLRFRAVEAPAIVRAVRYEADDGTDGWWDLVAVADAAGEALGDALTARVEDSSDGTARVVVGGAHGLRLTHRASGVVRREAYLLLAATARVEPV